MENNNCPFVVGQRVVALINAGCFVKGSIYTVYNCVQCKCGTWHIFISEFHKLNITHRYCIDCKVNFPAEFHFSSMRSFRFAPIQPLYSDITSSLAKEALEGIGDKVDGPVREIKETVNN